MLLLLNWELFGERWFRPFELLNLKSKDVDLTWVPGMVMVDGKAGDTRTVPIIKAFSFMDDTYGRCYTFKEGGL